MALAASLAAAACKHDTNPPRELPVHRAAEPAVDAVNVEPLPAPSAVDLSAKVPGPAYLAAEGVGLLKLVDGQLTAIADPYSTSSLSIGENGVVYAGTVQGILRIDRDKVAKIATHKPYAHYDALAAGRGGALYATDRNSLFRYDGHAWQTDPGSSFHGESIHAHVVVDHDGHPWVLAGHIYKRDGESWASVDVPGDSPISTFALSPSGELYVGLLDHRLRYGRGGAWHDLGELHTAASAIVVGPTGYMAASGNDTHVMIGAPGAAPRVIDLTSIGAQLTSARALAVDGSGRSWFASDNGVIIVDTSGKLLQQWKPGTLAGLNGKVTALAVVGAGPSLPGLRAEMHGTVVGKILAGGKPAAGAVIELCEEPRPLFSSSPCENASYVGSATTSADGAFRIANVPADSYVVSVSSDTWHRLVGIACCTSARPDADTDLGELTVP